MVTGIKQNEFDVVVIGGGVAGLFAAVEAAEMDASVVLIESQAEVGGSSRLSGGYVTLCETELAPGTRDELLEDLDDAHHHDSHFELSRVYTENSADTYYRLKDLGVEFVSTMQFSHMSQPWAHEPGGIGGGAELVLQLEKAAKRRGVQILTSARARALVRNAKGRVVGVSLLHDNITYTFSARKAVVLASGGFTRNLDLIRQYGRPDTEKITPLTGLGSLGDGLVMGTEVGADTAYLEIGVAPTGPVDPALNTMSLVNYKGAILVNKDGRRFCRESDVYLDLSWAGLKQPDSLMIQVYDSAIRQDYMQWQLAHVLGLCQEIKANTPEQLGAALNASHGVDAEGLSRTIAAYNGYVDHGEDPEFGRTHCVGTAGALRKLATPPFYAAVLVPGTTHFNGGLLVNRNMQVIDKQGDIILGLYAAGEVTGGFHGAGYMSGSFLGSSLIFGRIAGKNAADEVTRPV